MALRLSISAVDKMSHVKDRSRNSVEGRLNRNDHDSHSDSHSILCSDSMSISRQENTGRWTEDEHEVFVKGLRMHKKQWKLIAEMIKTRTVVQIRTHAQKYFQKLHKARGRGGDFKLDDDFDILDETFSAAGMKRSFSMTSDSTSEDDNSETDSEGPLTKRSVSCDSTVAPDTSRSTRGRSNLAEKSSKKATATAPSSSSSSSSTDSLNPSPKCVADMEDKDLKGFLTAPHVNSSSHSSLTYSAEGNTEALDWPRHHQQSRTVPNLFSPPNFDHFTTQFHLSQLPSGSTVPDFFAMNDPHCFDLLWTNQGGLDDIDLPQLGANSTGGASSASASSTATTAATNSALPRLSLEKSSSFAGSMDTYTSYEESVSDDSGVSVDDFDAAIFHPMHSYSSSSSSSSPAYGSGSGSSFGPTTADLVSGVLSKDQLNFHFDEDIFASGIFDALI